MFDTLISELSNRQSGVVDHATAQEMRNNLKPIPGLGKLDYVVGFLTQNHHFITVWIDLRRDHCLTLFADSLNLNSSWPLVQEFNRRFAEFYRRQLPNSEKRFGVTERVSCAQQSQNDYGDNDYDNGIDCGVFTCIFGTMVIQSLIDTRDQPNPDSKELIRANDDRVPTERRSRHIRWELAMALFTERGVLQYRDKAGPIHQYEETQEEEEQ
jgi:hypothetical protein